MNKPAFDGFETKEVTLITNKNVAAGKAVGITTNKRASIPSADELFCGICTAVKGVYASVALKGHATVAYTGTEPVLGYNKLAADGSGNVKVSENGIFAIVTDIDTVNKKIEIIL